MQERTGVITMKGNPLTLTGAEVKPGQKAPDFTVVGNDLSPVTLSSFLGKTVVISSVPSLDTGVCDTQTRKFNEEAGKLGGDVVVLTISMDLPFAQSRWRSEEVRCGGCYSCQDTVGLSDRRFRQQVRPADKRASAVGASSAGD